MNNQPIARELVLVGGGHSHVLLLRMLGMKPMPGLKVTLISPSIRTPYSGMLPGLIAGHYTEDQVYIDLVPLCRFAGAAFIQDYVVGLDLVNQALECKTRPAIRYDVLSLDVGITPASGGLPSGDKIILVKPISRFLAGWRTFLDGFGRQDGTGTNKSRQIGFVGTGAGGVELCLAVDYFLAEHFPGIDRRLHLFTDTKQILPGFNAGVQRRFESLLDRREVTLHREFYVTDYLDGALVSSQGSRVVIDHAFWVTHGVAPGWLAHAGLAVDDGGFVRVRDTLQAEGFDHVFAVGDCAVMVNHPRPRAGVYAVRQGKPLNSNIRALLLGRKLRAYRPQSQFLSLISTGDKQAVAARNGFSVAGAWVWRWKDWIDVRFMDRFRDLPQMTTPPAGALLAEFNQQMQCGGCGSKVSSDLLREVLTELTEAIAPHIAAGMALNTIPYEDAAVSSVPAGKLLLQSVDHFRAFYDDPYVLARIAVNHALSDIYACGGDPVTAMALLTLPFAKPDVTRGLLRQLMIGTLTQLAEDEVELVGGHTSEGVEMSIGFAVSGLVTQGSLWQKSGLTPGDVVILTQALGTGAIFAADMQHRAKGSWVMAALDQMLQSNRAAAKVLAQYPVTACTDVTGFGLAGHAIEMLRGSGAGLSIDSAALPILDGAMNCLLGPDRGGSIKSTLHESNRRAATLAAAVKVLVKNHHQAEIIFDPQTSGGLLAGVRPDSAAACVAALHQAGYGCASVVGLVTDEPGLVIR